MHAKDQVWLFEPNAVYYSCCQGSLRGIYDLHRLFSHIDKVSGHQFQEYQALDQSNENMNVSKGVQCLSKPWNN